MPIVCSVCRGTCKRDRPRGPEGAAARLLHRLDAAWRAQERRADGGEDCTVTNGGATAVATAFCRQRMPVG